MIIAVDFDGTVVEHSYPKIGKEIPFAIDVMKRLIQDGHQLILWTVREGELLQEAVKYCTDRGVSFYAVNESMPDVVPDEIGSRKITADLFIDDRNIGGLPDWGIIYQMIKSGRAFVPFNDQIQNEYQTKKTGLFGRLFG